MAFVLACLTGIIGFWLIGIIGFWSMIFALDILTAHKVINLYDLPYDTQEMILDLRCGNDGCCRGEHCCH